MPIRKVKGGYKWGSKGKVYKNRKDAERQAAAAYASGYVKKGWKEVLKKAKGPRSAYFFGSPSPRIRTVKGRKYLFIDRNTIYPFEENHPIYGDMTGEKQKEAGVYKFPLDMFLKSDPKKGTGKKPKGSARRLYTDENPKDTVPVKFKTAKDVRETFSSSAFKSKPHKRQSQIINLVEQRARVAAKRAKDPETKKRLNAAHKVALARKESSKRKTESRKRSAFTR